MTVAAPSARASVVTAIREVPFSVGVLLAGTFINKLGSFLQIFLVLFLTGRGFTAAEAGLALGAYGVGSILGVVLGGSATDRFGARATIAGSMILSALLTIALIYLTSFPVVLLIVALIGASAQAYRPASSALLTALIPESRRVMWFAAYRLAFNLGMTVGPILGAFVAQASYALLLAADAMTSLAFGALAIFALPRGVEAAHDEAPPAEGGYRLVLRDRRYMLFLVALFLHGVVYIQYMTTLPMQLSAGGASPKLFGTLVSLNALIVVACELPITQITQRHPMRRTIALGIGLVGLGFNLYALSAGTAALVFATVVWSLGEIVCSPAANAYPVSVAPPALRGRYLAAAAVPLSLGFAVGPMIGAALWERIGAGVWWWCGPVAAVAVIAAIAGVQREPTAAPKRSDAP